jgi:phospholipid/cholesterol/gamma-HCH transport system permease protein
MHRLGDSLIRAIREIGSIVLFFSRSLSLLLTRGVAFKPTLDQMYKSGVHSLSTTAVAGLFVGGIMAIQINMQLVDFGAQGFLGGLSTSVTIRNVGPVLIGFILSGKVGAYTSAELGTMRVTDQIDAIRCLGTDPVVYLVLPRLVAVVCSSFILLIVGLLITIAGGLLLSSVKLGVSASAFLANIPTIVNWGSMTMGIVKSLVFGLIIGVVCCYRGYFATGGAAGVGRTVRSTAVQTLVAIIIADFSLTQLFKFAADWVSR